MIIDINEVIVDTLGSSQVLFWYQDFPSKSNGSQFTGIKDIAPRARGRNQYKYVAAMPGRSLDCFGFWILWYLMPFDHFRTDIKL